MIGTIQLKPPAKSRSSRPSPRVHSPPRSQTWPPLPLSPDEADLAGRLSQVLAHPPHRAGEPATARPMDDLDFAVRLADVLRDDVDPPAPAVPSILPDPADDPAPAHASNPAAPWLKQARRVRWRSIAANSLPWLITLGVIAITVCGMFIALLGVPKSMELVAKASAHVQAGISQLQQP